MKPPSPDALHPTTEDKAAHVKSKSILGAAVVWTGIFSAIYALTTVYESPGGWFVAIVGGAVAGAATVVVPTFFPPPNEEK